MANLKIGTIFARLKLREFGNSGKQDSDSDSTAALQKEILACLKLAELNYKAALEVNPSFGKSIRNLQLMNSLLKELKPQTE